MTDRVVTIIDLSQAIAMGMPVYPGTEPVFVDKVATLVGQGYAEKRITFNSHTGTHIDAPSHIIAGGMNLASFSLAFFTGPACVVDIDSQHSGCVELAELLRAEQRIAGSEFVLLRSGWSRFWGTADYFDNYPVLSSEAAKWLSLFPLKGVGIDMISVDAVADTNYSNHRTLLARNILLIENLTNLATLPSANFTFSCLPLKIADADGAPVRAVALLT